MGKRTAENEVNYQERASEFAPGDLVVPYGHYDSVAGKVTAVWPAIGMVDVEFSMGNKRYPVEELQRLNPENVVSVPPHTNSVPGGQPTVSVPGGPSRPHNPTTLGPEHSARVAEAFVKRALYWNSPDRQYRATNEEIDSGHFQCPKCKGHGQQSVLRPAVYKRREGRSEKLLGCPLCLFLVKRSDIVGHPDYEEAQVGRPEPFADRRVA